jgi:hypothetical protein
MFHSTKLLSKGLAQIPASSLAAADTTGNVTMEKMVVNVTSRAA